MVAFRIVDRCRYVAQAAVVFFGLLSASAATLRAADPAPTFETTVAPFIKSHCVECHGGDNQESGLRLDTLTTDFQNEKTAAIWIRVFDRVAAGEMPPKESKRPSKAESEAFTAVLQERLHATSLEQQRKQGRVVVRRLNSTEYENTLRDLLATRVALKDLLPEEGETAGFDNVSSGLDLSATHLLRYQDAAEKAIMSTLPIHPPISFSDKRTGLEMTQKGPNFKQGLGRNSKLDGDALLFYSKLPRYGLCSTAAVPTSGRYRIQMKACAVGGGGKAIPVGFLTVENGPEDSILREVREILPGEPQVIEFEFDLARRQAFVVNLLTIWDIRNFKKPLEEYTGLGLRVDWLKVEGPIDAYPPPSYERLFKGVELKARSVAKAEHEKTQVRRIPANRPEASWYADPLVPVSANPMQDAERLIRDFLPRAFRRPVAEDVQKHFVGRVQEKLDQNYQFFDAMMFGYKLILSAPDFLFLMDSPNSVVTPEGDLISPKLDSYSLAERLSYFLWSSGPDDELLAAAAKGNLNDTKVLHAQVERMLESPKAHRLTENFAGQWLDLRKIDATIPDPQLYGDFDYLLLWSMPRETQLFFEEILRNDLSLLDFVDSDWSMLNERLAWQYGIPGVEGNDFRKVKLPPGCHRGGVMTQASILKVTADGTRTSPILRGKWVLERIVGKPPQPPPPDIPTIEPDIRGAVTIRQQLDKHRNTPACAACHVHIDPPGFALETFDPIGNWREFYRVGIRPDRAVPIDIRSFGTRPVYRGLNVEKGDRTPDGRPFADIDEYKKILLEDPDQIARNLTQKLLIYATGADIQFADREIVEGIVAAVRKNNYGLRSLIHEIVQSRAFLNK